MDHEPTEWHLEVLDVALNDPPVTYTVKFVGHIEGHMIQLTFELPTTIKRKTVIDWAPYEIRARLWVFSRTHPIVRFAIQNTNAEVQCTQCRFPTSPGGTRFSLKHSVDKVWLTVPRNFDFHNIKRNEDFLLCIVKAQW